MSLRPSEPGAKKVETNPVKRFYSKPTRKNAISAMCAHCVGCTSVEQGFPTGDHLEVGFRIDISNCSHSACALLAYRPFQRMANIQKPNVKSFKDADHLDTRPTEPGSRMVEVNPIKRYYAKPTRKNAIHAKCAECMGCTATEQQNGQEDHLERGFRNLIKYCRSLACPLFRFRPFQT